MDYPLKRKKKEGMVPPSRSLFILLFTAGVFLFCMKKKKKEEKATLRFLYLSLRLFACCFVLVGSLLFSYTPASFLTPVQEHEAMFCWTTAGAVSFFFLHLFSSACSGSVFTVFSGLAARL